MIENCWIRSKAWGIGRLVKNVDAQKFDHLSKFFTGLFTEILYYFAAKAVVALIQIPNLIKCLFVNFLSENIRGFLRRKISIIGNHLFRSGLVAEKHTDSPAMVNRCRQGGALLFFATWGSMEVPSVVIKGHRGKPRRNGPVSTPAFLQGQFPEAAWLKGDIMSEVWNLEPPLGTSVCGRWCQPITWRPRGLGQREFCGFLCFLRGYQVGQTNLFREPTCVSTKLTLEAAQRIHKDHLTLPCTVF